MKRPRQFRVTEVATGLQTYVTVPYDGTGNGYRNAAVRAGFSQEQYYQRHTLRVSLMREDFERPLPFDCIPLVIRRGHKKPKAAAEPAHELVAAL